MKPFLHFALLAVILAPFAVCQPIGSSTDTTPGPVYRLRFFHTHTNERIDIVYRRGDTYLPEALNQLDYYLRDWRTGEVHHYDPRLFDVLHDLLASVGQPDDEINVICGFRTPQTNEYLRTRHPTPALPRTASTCRPKPSTFACRTSRLPGCGTRPWHCAEAG